MPTPARKYSIAVAPMMDWTDRHCRYFMRLLSPGALLYTEMITANALHFGDADSLLRYDASEHPIAVQLGGSDPALMAELKRRGARFREFPQDLDRVIAALPRLPREEVERVYAISRGFYFDHVDDPRRQQAFEDRLRDGD